MEVRAQPARQSGRPPCSEPGRGKGRSEPGSAAAHAKEPPRGGGDAEGRDCSAASARGGGGEGRSKSGPVPTGSDSETPPAPIAPETAPRSALHTRCPNREPQSGGRRLAPPRRLSLRAAECARPEAGSCCQAQATSAAPARCRRQPGKRGRRRRGGVLLSRPPPSPRPGPHVKARWSEAAVAALLPRCSARAESAAEADPPPPGGTWRTPESFAGRRRAPPGSE